jgi:hypothetical protein
MSQNPGELLQVGPSCGRTFRAAYFFSVTTQKSAGESQDRIEAIGRKTTRVIVDIGALAVDCGMRTHLPHEFYPFHGD